MTNSCSLRPFELGPGAGALADFVFRVLQLGNETFEAARFHLAHHAGGIGLDAGGEANGGRQIHDQGLRHRFALPQRQAGKVFAVQVEQVENVIEKRRLFGAGGLVGLEQLKGRTPLRIDGDNFAIEHGFFGRQLPEWLDHSRVLRTSNPWPRGKSKRPGVWF